MIEKLIEAKKSFKTIKKAATNPHYKNKYMTLDDIVDATSEALASQGLVVINTIQNGELVTEITDGKGSIKSFYPLKAENKNDQQLGSALSYGRRYNLCCLLNIVADEDDDGNKASEPVSPQIQYLQKLRSELEQAKSSSDIQEIKTRWEKGKEKLSQLRIFDQGLQMIELKGESV